MKLQLLALGFLDLANSNGRIFDGRVAKTVEFLGTCSAWRHVVPRPTFESMRSGSILDGPSLLLNFENPSDQESGLRLEPGINRLLSR